MTHQLPDTVQSVAEFLRLDHGRYLHNAVRERGLTCEVCTTPVNIALDARCPQCRSHDQSDIAVADRVGVMVYAEEYESQAYKVVRGYKGDGLGADQLRVMQALLALGLRGHIGCDMLVSGHLSTGWAVVPSTKGRHRLGEIARSLSRRPEAEVPLSVSSNLVKRTLRPENFVVGAGTALPEHVLLVDDSWVSGSNAQSAAAALKQAGVQDVSVLVVARVLNPKFEPTARFLKAQWRDVFDPTLCPWTGGRCP